ncbi:MAG TPA: Maf family protein [Victivallales bacterium]|nr:Maf family protein [Victivallales bacterium]
MIVLASNSPRRVEILHRLNFKFRKISPSFDEKKFNKSDLRPELVPLILAEKKALSISEYYEKDMVIGCDTVVLLNNDIYEKPCSIDEAIDMLRKLSGKTHRVITGVSLIINSESIKCCFTDTSYVTFKNISTDEINQYFKFVNPLDKAGGYAIQEKGELIIDSVKGSFDNIVGFPSEKIVKSIAIIRALLI